jgi:alpha-tubulin suppressor-like RCC1 family protein
MERERDRNKKTNDSYVENNNNRLISLMNKKPEIEEKRSDSIYTKNILVYGWGKNKYGELGLGHNTNLNIPK